VNLRRKGGCQARAEAVDGKAPGPSGGRAAPAGTLQRESGAPGAITLPPDSTQGKAGSKVAAATGNRSVRRGWAFPCSAVSVVSVGFRGPGWGLGGPVLGGACPPRLAIGLGRCVPPSGVPICAQKRPGPVVCSKPKLTRQSGNGASPGGRSGGLPAAGWRSRAADRRRRKKGLVLRGGCGGGRCPAPAHRGRERNTEGGPLAEAALHGSLSAQPGGDAPADEETEGAAHVSPQGGPGRFSRSARSDAGRGGRSAAQIRFRHHASRSRRVWSKGISGRQSASRAAFSADPTMEGTSP
jgi:hypothetical protein